jgi:hypothetical protein
MRTEDIVVCWWGGGDDIKADYGGGGSSMVKIEERKGRGKSRLIYPPSVAETLSGRGVLSGRPPASVFTPTHSRAGHTMSLSGGKRRHTLVGAV